MKHPYCRTLSFLLLPSLLGACATLTGSHTPPPTSAQAKAAAFKKAYPDGLPPVGSPFSKLKIGMGIQRVPYLIGKPTSETQHQVAFTLANQVLGAVTFGMDKSADQITILKTWRYRHEGTLVFMTHHADAIHRGRLIRIVVNPRESGFHS